MGKANVETAKGTTMGEWAVTDREMRRIGTVTLVEEKTFENTYGTACWYERVRCAPQTAVLRSNGNVVVYDFSGVVTESYKPSRAAGRLGVNRHDVKVVGKTGVHSGLEDASIVAARVGDAEGSLPYLRFELDAGYGTTAEPFQLSDGRTVRLRSVTVPEDGHPVTIRPAGTRRDPQGSPRGFATFDVFYRGEQRGSVEVREGQSVYGQAQAAADELVFGDPQAE